MKFWSYVRLLLMDNIYWKHLHIILAIVQSAQENINTLSITFKVSIKLVLQDVISNIWKKKEDWKQRGNAYLDWKFLRIDILKIGHFYYHENVRIYWLYRYCKEKSNSRTWRKRKLGKIPDDWVQICSINLRKTGKQNP